LLVDANRPVSTARLVDVIWGESPPATAVQQVQNCIGSLRQSLIRLGQQPELIREASSYSLLAAPSMIDAKVFVERCVAAEGAAKRGELAEASAGLRQAIDLWYGPPLEDVNSDALSGAVIRLKELRVRALEHYAQVELARGHDAGLVAELAEWAGDHAYHEGLHGYLALALHRLGRTVEGLRVLHHLRLRLMTELGIEPGAFVNKVHADLLDAGPVAVPSPLSTGEPAGLDAIRASITALSDAVEQLTVVVTSALGAQHGAPGAIPRPRVADPRELAAS
jgi:DNA-binding SARP family transcriptional activator